jgi:hypothetical protein
MADGFLETNLSATANMANAPDLILVVGPASKDTWRNTGVSGLTFQGHSQRSKFKMSPLVGTFHYYWPRIQYSNLVWIIYM